MSTATSEPSIQKRPTMFNSNKRTLILGFDMVKLSLCSRLTMGQKFNTTIRVLLDFFLRPVVKK